MSYYKKEEDPNEPKFKGDTFEGWKTRKLGLYRKLNYGYTEDEAIGVMNELITILKEIIECDDYVAYFVTKPIKSYFLKTYLP